jgi:hypothetical protein
MVTVAHNQLNQLVVSHSKMKKYVLAALALVAALILLSSVQAAPKMTLPETEFDFGFVPQHSQIAHIFWIYSTGDDTLKIVKVVPG